MRVCFCLSKRVILETDGNSLFGAVCQVLIFAMYFFTNLT
jgi:hypothetical protein